MSQKSIRTYKISRNDMKSIKNCFMHAIYLFIYGFVKYWSFPMSNYMRYLVLKIFAKKLKSSYISDGVTVWFPHKLSIGRNSSLNQGCNLHALGGIEIGDNVRIACYTTIYSADHEYNQPGKAVKEQGYICGKIIIEDDVWIGARVNINKAVRVQTGAVIGGGSVVTKDVPAFAVVAGSPAQIIKYRNANESWQEL